MTQTIQKDAPIYVAGHTGLVGSAILRRLEAEGHHNLLLATRDELDLRDQSAVYAWFREKRPASGRRTTTVANACWRTPGIAASTRLIAVPIPKIANGQWPTVRTRTTSKFAVRAMLERAACVTKVVGSGAFRSPNASAMRYTARR